MKKLFILLLTIFLTACGAKSSSTLPSSLPITSTTSTASGVCQDMTHVYNAARLTVLNQCVVVTGIIKAVRSEADGDKHILVQPDSNQLDPNGGNWINSCNITCNNGAEKGFLVTEPVCVGPISQTDVDGTCDGYINPTPIPSIGDHVQVSGSWVLDIVHGWLEIHPAFYVIL